MLDGRFCFLVLAVAAGLWAQTDVPVFTRPMRGDGERAQLLRPGDIAVIYGSHLAPAGGCAQGPPPGGSYPTELCDTQVTVGGVPAGLLFVGRNQINLKVPAGIPASGEAAMVVTVRGVSSAPVMVPVGTQKVVLSLAGPAYVNMPVWISLDRPVPGDTRYPYLLGPQSFGGGSFEVRRGGVMLKPLEIRPQGGPMMINGALNGSIAPADSPRGRLPLHLRYRSDVPGKYEVRFVGTREEPDPARGLRTVQVDESDWTEIEILPYSEAQRREWIEDQVAKMPSSPGLLMGDAIPGLLALPDEFALAAILPELYHPDEGVRRYVASCLGMFDSALLAKQLTPLISQKGPTEEIVRLLDNKEDLFAGGHAAFIAALPSFLHSDSPLAQESTLQYIAWVQNHDWGRSPEILKQNSTMVLEVAPAIIERGDERLNHVLALALGSIKTDGSRELLWQMIESGKAREQSMICLTWIGDARDLPRLAAIMMQADQGDPSGHQNASLAYSLHHAYGDASLPWLRQAARDTRQIPVRSASAEELILANQPDGFKYLLQAMDEMPTFKTDGVQFMRDHFPDLRNAPEDAVVTSLRSMAAQ